MDGRIEQPARDGAASAPRMQPRRRTTSVVRRRDGRNAQRNQNTACPLIRLGSHVEKNGMCVTMLIALKIAR